MNESQSYKGITLSFDRGTLLVTGAGIEKFVSILEPGLFKRDDRVSAWRCEAIHYAAIIEALEEHFHGRFCDTVYKPVDVSLPKVDLPRLRDEQQQALESWSMAGCRGQVIMPTGTGKTEVALAAMARTKTATLIVAPVRDLMYQWHRRILRAFDYDCGIVGDGLSDIKPITVTTYDSAYIHMARMGAGFGLLIFDEEHHLPGKYRREAAILSTAGMRMGLTATPQRL